MNNISIQRASVSEIDSLALLFDLYRQFYKKDSDLVSAKKFLETRLNNEESVIFSANFKNVTVGFLQLYPSFSSVSMSKTWILNDLFVSKDARGMGVGKGLITAAEKFARSTGALGMSLETGKDNHAKYLYQSMGWKVDEQYEHFSLTL